MYKVLPPSERQKPIEIHRHMTLQKNNACLYLHIVSEWSRKIEDAMSVVTNATRLDQTY